MPHFSKINQFCFDSLLLFRIPIDVGHCFRFLSKSGCHGPELVAAMLRIGWPPWFGINGRLAPDYALVSLNRNEEK